MRADPPAPTAQRLAQLESWHFWFVGRDRLVVNVLRRFGREDPVLDIGCGTGSFAAQLSESGGPVMILDHTLASRPAPGVHGVRGDAEHLPYRDGWAGVLLARDVLEHVNDGLALEECRRVLRPGGLLVALVPAWPALWSERDEQARHRRRYTRSSLKEVLGRAGFRVLELRGYQFALLPLVAASRLAARRRPREQLRAEERPPTLLNGLLARVNRAEAGLARVRWPRPPTGSTLVAVAQRHDR